MASSDFKPEELHKKTGRSFEITTWQMLNEVLQQHFQDKSLIGISLKKVENPIASLTPINVDKEAQKRDVEK